LEAHFTKLSVVATSDEPGAVLTAFAGGVELAQILGTRCPGCIFKERWAARSSRPRSCFELIAWLSKAEKTEKSQHKNHNQDDPENRHGPPFSVLRELPEIHGG
jgi:hypothetical protein